MSKRSQVETLRSNLAEHPASRAWCELRGTRKAPMEIAILKQRNDSKVYKLTGVGPRSADVIAKHCPRTSALSEHMVYRELLPHMPIGRLEYYGLWQEAGDDFCWIFVEDGGGVRYRAEIPEHGILAAQWLALLHTSVPEAARALNLRHWGTNDYLASLRAGRERIRRSLKNPALQREEAAVVEAILGQCDLLETRWRRVEELCEGMPLTLVHADFHDKNLCVRTTADTTVLLPFDWESAGWGIPAVDLALTGLHIPTYWDAVRKCWPKLDRLAVERSIVAGQIFELLALVDWESRGLSDRWLHKPIQRMRYYHLELDDVLQAKQWCR